MSNPSTQSKYIFRQSLAAAPSLGFAESFWALSQRPDSIADALERAVLDGFGYLEVGLREERLDETRSLLKRLPLRLIAQGWARSAEDAIAYLQRAADLSASALNLQLGNAYLSLHEATDLIGEVQHAAGLYGIPLLLETHRGRLTQDLFRTSELLAACPETIMALDLSHYIVAAENLGESRELFHQYLAPVLARTTLIHGRISNGQAVQVAENPVDNETFLAVWQRTMQLWLEGAPPDAVFVFEPELGPPPYAMLDADGAEISDRAEQSRTLTCLARSTWANAQRQTFHPTQESPHVSSR